ncbi:MAG TPA: glycosyltransferase family 9 protein, partial [Pyrinomonadaceae bacterium]
MNAPLKSATRHASESAPVAPAFAAARAQPLAPARWDWGGVRRVLVVRLRSIGDTVLSTPSLYALRRFLPDAQIDLLLEDWVAPLLDGNPDASRILTVRRDSTTSRLALVRRLRAARYDVAFNLHGGSTAALLTRASGARRRVGYESYRFSRLHNYAAPPATDLWRQPKTHSVEQQLGLLGWVGVPVTDRPATRLFVTDEAAARVARRLDEAGVRASQPIA